jgi:PAS domain S-box-containing protein
MPPDQFRTPIATKNLLRPFELIVTERSLKRPGGIVPLGGWALDISLALIQAALNLAYHLIFHERGRMSLPFSEPASAVPVEVAARQSSSAKLLSADETIEIDEAKKVEDRLRRSETWLAQAQRLSHTGTWVLDGTTRRFLYWSDESYRIWGFDPLQGLPSRDDMWERIHPDDRERVWGGVQKALREKRDFIAEFRLLLPDETVKYLETIAHHEFSPVGALLEVICTIVDVTGRKYAEQTLRESERKLRQLIESVPCHFWSMTPNGEPTYVNQRLLDYFGLRFEDQNRDGVTEEFLHPDDVAETERALNHAFQTGESFQRVHRLRRADGEYRWHRVRAEPQRDPEGKIVQWYGLSVDIDEHKRSEERLRVQHAVAQILAEAATIEEPTSRILRTIGEYLGWDVGALWRVDREAGALRCVELWHKASIEVPEFERISREFTFVPGLGLPGRVWSSLEPEYVPDVLSDENFPRASIAEREGLHAALGFPILFGGEVLGVIECFSGEIKQPNQEVLDMLATIGSQIGQFTERKRAEQALRESEAKFRDFAETASDWFCEMGPDYKFTLLSENAFGSGAADLIGTACWDHALDLETEPEKWRLLQETVSSRKPFRDFVYRGLSSDGAPMYVRASGKPLFDDNGEFQGYRGTYTDVTEIMRTQEALRESERSARSAIDGMAGLIAIMTPNGELETVNRQVFEYFGRSLEWLKNWGTNDAVHPEDLPHVVEVFTRAVASGTPYHYDQRLRRFDGEYRWFDVRGLPIRDDSGRIARWYVLLTDIDDRTRALAQLEQMQSNFAHMNRVSMMGELAASLSHEILHPIATARNNARAGIRFLEMSPPNLDAARESFGCVVRDADRAKDIAGRIRNQIKKAPSRKGLFDLNEAVSEVIAMVRSAIAKSGISVSTLLADGLAPVHGDRVQLQQVLVNLILNAVEAMSSVEDGTRELLIRAEQSQTGGTLVAVHDSGPGVDPVNPERVFEPFYTTKTSGIGMGLSICQTIIHGHGGRLWMCANEPRGTVFQFTLPVAQSRTLSCLQIDVPGCKAERRHRSRSSSSNGLLR